MGEKQMKENQFRQTGYVVNPADCVGTALGDISPGDFALKGAGAAKYSGMAAAEFIPEGHKFALCQIKSGEPIVKYGAEIGVATKDIEPGEHVHLHNIKSRFDDRSATLDVETADSTDMEYRLY